MHHVCVVRPFPVVFCIAMRLSTIEVESDRDQNRQYYENNWHLTGPRDQPDPGRAASLRRLKIMVMPRIDSRASEVITLQRRFRAIAR